MKNKQVTWGASQTSKQLLPAVINASRHFSYTINLHSTLKKYNVQLVHLGNALQSTSRNLPIILEILTHLTNQGLLKNAPTQKIIQGRIWALQKEISRYANTD